MIKPQRLKPGDTIAFYSPSSPATAFAPKRFKRAKAYLESKGFQLLAGNLTGKSAGYRSGTIKERVKELNDLIRNPEVRCIMSTIGGMNSNSLLPYIDYDALAADPKILIGYSDVTAILLGVYAKTGLITFYGPALVASFGEFEPLVGITYQSFEEILLLCLSWVAVMRARRITAVTTKNVSLNTCTVIPSNHLQLLVSKRGRRGAGRG
ncbi:MAG: hypothetical protein GY943_21960 [Chloroflexi bacterium]|nr:hypothetical protein [Chloroflexota bacterium]